MDPVLEFRRLAEAHERDDLEECLRFRHVPLEERARLFAGLCRLALAATGGRSLEPEPRSPQAEAWWRELVRCRRCASHV